MLPSIFRPGVFFRIRFPFADSHGNLTLHVKGGTVILHPDNQPVRIIHHAKVDSGFLFTLRKAMLNDVCRQFLKAKRRPESGFLINPMPFAEQHDLLGGQGNVLIVPDVQVNDIAGLMAERFRKVQVILQFRIIFLF